MKMTRLHMQFVLIFVTAENQAELGRTAAECLRSLTHWFKQLNWGKIDLHVNVLTSRSTKKFFQNP